MKSINQVLITIIEANRLVNAQNPHHQRLGLLLLDNIIEVQFRRRVEIAMMFDKTTWSSGVRKYNRRRRVKVARFHGELLALGVEENFITTQDQQMLAYGHRLRNHLYHEGREEDETDLDLGICLLFRFIVKHFPDWRGASGVMMIPPEPAIPYTEAMSDQSGQAPLMFGFEEVDPDVLFPDTEDFFKIDHWRSILSAIVTYDFKKDVRPLIAQRIQNLLDQLKSNIEFLTRDDDNDFNGVFSQRFAIMTNWFLENEKKSCPMNNPNVAVNIYLALNGHEERLLDIEDPNERQIEFFKVLNSHDFKKDILSSIDFARYQHLIDTVQTQSEAEGIANFLVAENELRELVDAVDECATDLDGYTQFMIDVIRGN
ncbi:hypothetical protein [Gimesia sp.]|uniref:hypothetical protein n=1 Tax=Gimesia sp. TaxID=2024833 RepID=UPI0032EDC5F9